MSAKNFRSGISRNLGESGGRATAEAVANLQPSEQQYLQSLGERVRRLRLRRELTRKALAMTAGVSERYLAQLESGRGNVSILLLRQISRALGVSAETIVIEGPEPTQELLEVTAALKKLSPSQQREARQLLEERFTSGLAAEKRHRIALIGLRGAGKSTLGAMLAERLDLPFLELDRIVEQENGLALGAIFDLYGQAGFHRLERQSLDHVLERYPRFVLATGGGIVSQQATYERLLATCSTIWLRATPEDHMNRVISQGDRRPMQANPQAMNDLRRILASREPLYAKAGATVDTSATTLSEALHKLLQCV